MMGNMEGCETKKGEVVEVHVQAVMLWSAGAVDIEAYERTVEGRKALRAAEE